MKRILLLVMTAIMLCGCSRGSDEFDRAMSLRTDLINANGCSFVAKVTADFSDKTYTFIMRCQSDKDGNLEFEVLEPEYISGIKGNIRYDGGKLTFDDIALAFGLQADGLISPVSAPWVLVRALRGGYVRYCGREEQFLRLTVDDSYEEDALMLDIWIGADNKPVQADIYENNKRILTLVVSDFQLL